MALIDEIAAKLSGRTRAEENTVLTDATTRTYIGTATSDSSDGSVYVALSEDVTMPDDYDGEHGVGVEMPTTVGVSEGDDVVVTVFGGGTMKAPVVTGNPGWGDDVDTRVTEAHDLAASVEGIAQEAKEVAEATGQHFWPDEQGVHVTEVTQDEWNDSTSPNYHSGANVLLNALGQLFRDGINNLLSLTTGATYTETFQIRSDDQNRYTLVNKPMAVQSVTIDGTATSDYRWYNYDMLDGGTGGGTVTLGSETWADNYGSTLSVTYRTSPAMTVWDGLGNLASNVMSYFTADEIGLGGSIFADPHGTSRGAAVRFFGATDEQGASLTSGIQRDSAADYISYVDTIGLTGTTTDEGAALSNGCIADYGITAMGYLYDDSESSNDYRAESTANLYARSRSSDAADATARLGVKTVTVGDNYERSYVTLGDGTGEDSEVLMRQVLCALLHPCATYTAAVGTWTGITNAWQPAGFGVVVTESGNFTDYIDVASKGVGEFVALVGCTVRVAACVTWVDSVAGRRSVGAFVNATRSGNNLSGGTEYSNSGLFYTGNNAKTAQLTPVVLHLAAGNRLNIGKYAPANAVQSNQAYKMNWVTIEVLAVD